MSNFELFGYIGPSISKCSAITTACPIMADVLATYGIRSQTKEEFALLPCFCFPEIGGIVRRIPPKNIVEELRNKFSIGKHFCFVLSGGSGISTAGEAQFGFCVLTTDIDLDPQRKNYLSLPRCFCIISKIPNYAFWFAVLDKIVTKCKDHFVKDFAGNLTNNIARRKRLTPFDFPKSVVSMLRSIQTGPVEDIHEISMPLSIHIGEKNAIASHFRGYTVSMLLAIVPIDQILVALSLLLLEHSLIIFHPSLTESSFATLGLQALLHPIEWHGSIFPVLPSEYRDLVESPVPIIAGTTDRVLKDRVLKSVGGAVFNLEEGMVEFPPNATTDTTHPFHRFHELKMPRMDTTAHRLTGLIEKFKKQLDRTDELSNSSPPQKYSPQKPQQPQDNMNPRSYRYHQQQQQRSQPQYSHNRLQTQSNHRQQQQQFQQGYGHQTTTTTTTRRRLSHYSNTTPARQVMQPPQKYSPQKPQQPQDNMNPRSYRYHQQQQQRSQPQYSHNRLQTQSNHRQQQQQFQQGYGHQTTTTTTTRRRLSHYSNTTPARQVMQPPQQQHYTQNQNYKYYSQQDSVPIQQQQQYRNSGTTSRSRRGLQQSKSLRTNNPHSGFMMNDNDMTLMSSSPPSEFTNLPGSSRNLVPNSRKRMSLPGPIKSQSARDLPSSNFRRPSSPTPSLLSTSSNSSSLTMHSKKFDYRSSSPSPEKAERKSPDSIIPTFKRHNADEILCHCIQYATKPFHSKDPDFIHPVKDLLTTINEICDDILKCIEEVCSGTEQLKEVLDGLSDDATDQEKELAAETVATPQHYAFLSVFLQTQGYQEWRSKALNRFEIPASLDMKDFLAKSQ
eukprot:TRINITY_DN2488_c1_g1_i1.p1 TRINITY_DN2488_c1_g1~~TRINITY_DN2488_c1_g1_i1.p1  ORF type:complete len:838 (-),score=201.84 TRINITY_DN2488_c1_g1_i1:201-2714(-)